MIKVRNLLRLLPEATRHSLIRSRLKLNREGPGDLIFKLAETREELEQAFSVLHDAYVDQGFMDPHPSGLRVTKYHALPTTAVLIAKSRTTNTVVGTLSIVRDSALGLPLDSAYSLTETKAKCRHLAEVSALAIRREDRHKAQQVLWPLLRYFYRYARFVMKLDAYIIGINPKWHDLYVGILGFERLHDLEEKAYEFVKDAPVAAYLAKVLDQESIFFRDYSHQKTESNWYEYCIKAELDPAENVFPTDRYHSVQQPVMSPSLLKYFFKERTDALALLTERELAVIQNFYPTKAFADVFGSKRLSSIGPRRSVARSMARLRAFHRDEFDGSFLAELEVIDLSSGGLRIISPRPLPNLFEMSIVVGPCDVATLKVAVKRESNSVYGVKIVENDLTWKNFLEHREQTMTFESSDASSSLKSLVVDRRRAG